MNIQEIINNLEAIKTKHGNLDAKKSVDNGYLLPIHAISVSDASPLRPNKLVVI